MRIQVIAGLCVLLAAPVCAQAVDGGGVPFRVWDGSVNAALHFERDSRPFATVRDAPGWDGTASFAVQAGRYWTSHAKTEVGVVRVITPDGYEADLVKVSGAGPQYAYSRTRTRITHISLAQTYQFFDNVFAHPYVSAGARVGVADFHKEPDPYATLSGRSGPASVDPEERDERQVRVRPFAAAGFKSYFNERAFLRSDMSAAFDSRGLEHLAIALGFGVDF